MNHEDQPHRPTHHERYACDHFDVRDWVAGVVVWRAGEPDPFLPPPSDTSTSEPPAVGTDDSSELP